MFNSSESKGPHSITTTLIIMLNNPFDVKMTSLMSFSRQNDNKLRQLATWEYFYMKFYNFQFK